LAAPGHPAAPRATPPAVFAFTILPFGAAVGFVSIAAPYWLEAQGVSLAAIGTVSGIANSPHAFKFLWAPLVDLGGHRKRWYVATTALTAATLAGLAFFPEPGRHLAAYTALAALCQVAATTSATAADGLMASTTRAEDRGRAAGFRMAGNVGFTGVLGAVALWVASASGSVALAGAVLAAVTLLAILPALPIAELRAPVTEALHWLHDLRVKLGAVLRDVWGTLTSREGLTGLVICAVPVGAGALTNLFSAMASGYHASGDLVALVNGLGGGLLGALGALVGGRLADRMNRRLAYALAGGLTTLTALGLLVAPMTPASYAAGALAYSFANGIAFATLAAFILEMCGHGAGAATKYTAFIAVANLASSYVTALDGWGSELPGLGVRGAIVVDIVLTVAGIAVLLAMVSLNRRRVAAPAP
jgi:MFS transporter, PAT family, beta-lactamase induction signal transducer AmpG